MNSLGLRKELNELYSLIIELSLEENEPQKISIFQELLDLIPYIHNLIEDNQEEAFDCWLYAESLLTRLDLQNVSES